MNSRFLGEVASTVMGQAPPGMECNKTGLGTVFVKAGEFDERFPVVREWTTKPLKFAREGDVLVCVVGATAGKVNQAIDCAIGRSVAAIRPNNGMLDTSYLYHFLFSRTENLRKKSQGLAQGVITRDMLHELEIPLPPLEEQKRIAAILDQADSLRRLRQRAIDRLNTLGQAIFYEMFGDPRTNALGWRTKTLGEIGILGRGVSKHRPRNDPVLLGGKHPLVQTGDVANADGFIRTYQATYSDSGLRQSKLWPRGTLCITIAANIGKTAILDFDACFPDSVVGFTPGPDTTTEYVQYWFAFIQEKLEREAPQSAQKNINLASLSELEIPLPPFGIQQRFSQCIKEVDSRKLEFKDHLKVSCCLFSSLQHRAFRGEL